MNGGAGRLLLALRTAGIAADPGELADALWLAQRMLAEAAAAEDILSAPPPELTKTPKDEGSPVAPEPLPSEPLAKSPSITEPTPLPSDTQPEDVPVHLPRPGKMSA